MMLYQAKMEGLRVAMQLYDYNDKGKGDVGTLLEDARKIEAYLMEAEEPPPMSEAARKQREVIDGIYANRARKEAQAQPPLPLEEPAMSETQACRKLKIGLLRVRSMVERGHLSKIVERSGRVMITGVDAYVRANGMPKHTRIRKATAK